jgi:hypothetical protein
MLPSGISQADIARRAGVGRAAVGNWRARHPDFPQPNGGTRRSPTFDPDAVDRWLSEHGTHTTAASLPGKPAGSAPPSAEPLLNLLRKAHSRKPGAWLLHEEIVDNEVATAFLIRRLVNSNEIQRARISFPSGPRVVLRLPHVDDGSLDTDDIERQANAALTAVGCRVTIHPAQDTASKYRPVKITHRNIRYTGYQLVRPWVVRVAEIGPDAASTARDQARRTRRRR